MTQESKSSAPSPELERLVALAKVAESVSMRFVGAARGLVFREVLRHVLADEQAKREIVFRAQVEGRIVPAAERPRPSLIGGASQFGASQ